MNCPSCGRDNIAGVDACEKCGQGLSEDWAEDHSQLGIFAQPLTELGARLPVCVSADTSLAEVVTLLKEKGIGCVLVTGETQELVGIFTERDVLYRVAGLIEQLEEVAVESLMTPRPSSLKSTLPISHALHLMGAHGFRHVPLVDDEGKPTGYISFRDVLRFIEENFGGTVESNK